MTSWQAYKTIAAYGTNGVATRTDTVVNWYDPANRLTDSVDYGINGPSTQPSSPPTSSTSTALLTHYTYNVSSGYLETTTDPNATVTWQKDDALGRPIIVVQGGSSDAAYGTDVLTTDYQYNGADEITRQTVLNYQPGATSATDTAHLQSQVTINTYGGSGTLDQSLLTNVQYSAGGSESYTYDYLGEVHTYTDRSGDTHTYTYDSIGRQTLDAATGFAAGSTTDRSVLALGTTYDTLGNVLASTSYSDIAATNILNQVSHEYNGFGQVIADFDNPGGSTEDTEPTLQYAYDQGNNDSRLTGETYVDGRVIAYGYGGSPIDDEIDRIDQTSLGTASGSGVNLVITPTSLLETDSYLGNSMVMGRSLPQISVTESTSLNSLNQVTGLDWVQARPGTTGADLDQYTYTYDNDGRVQTRGDIGGNAGTDPINVQQFNYNSLGNLTSYVVTNQSLSQITTTYSPDSMGNRTQPTVTYDSSNESSTSKPVGGNTTQLTTGPSTGATVIYDAWGRVRTVTPTVYNPLTGQQDPTSEVFYTYDALGRLITQLAPHGTISTKTSTLYDTFNNPVEVAVASNGNSTLMNNIWSGADGRIIARETVGSKFVYALTDAQGSVTSLVDYGTMVDQTAPTWQVYERYSYNADGMATAYSVSWQPISTSSGGTIGAYGWTILWQGEQRIGIYSNYALYSSVDGEGWYDPQQARTLSPAPIATGNGGYTLTNEQLNNSWGDNFIDALFDPSSFGSMAEGSGHGWMAVAGGVAQTIGIAALATAAAVAAPVLLPFAAAAGVLYTGYQAYEGYEQYGGWSGAAAKASGWSSISEAWSNQDWGSGQVLDLTDEERGAMGAGGAIQLGGTFLAAYGIGGAMWDVANADFSGIGPSLAYAGGGSGAATAGSAMAVSLGQAGSAGFGMLAGNALYSTYSGAPTGPKTDNRFGHNRTIRQVAREVTAKGDEVIAGGRQFDGIYRKEAIFDTPGGFKSARRPDLLVMRPDGSVYGINVGRTEASGLPVLRERLAIQDLNEQVGLEMQFVSYGRSR